MSAGCLRRAIPDAQSDLGPHQWELRIAEPRVRGFEPTIADAHPIADPAIRFGFPDVDGVLQAIEVERETIGVVVAGIAGDGHAKADQVVRVDGTDQRARVAGALGE